MCPRRAAVAGLFLDVALLIKPSTFVMTTLLYSGAIFSRIIAAVWENHWRSARRKILLGSLAFVGTVLVVAGPYWLHFGKEAISYFMENSFGAYKAIWVYQGSLSESLLFYVTGQGVRSNVAIAGIIISLFAQAGPIFMETTGLWFAFHHLKVQNASAAFFRTEAQFKESYPDYSWIVLQELGTMGFVANMPINRLFAQFKNIIKTILITGFSKSSTLQMAKKYGFMLADHNR